MLLKYTTTLRKYALLILAAITLLAMIPNAFASTVLKLDLESLVANSDQIIIGRVTNLESYIEQDGRVYTAITIDVDESLKGQPEQQLVIRQIGGRTDDLATIVPGMPDFKPQEEVILFLELHNTPTAISHRNTDANQKVPVITGMAQGKFSVAIGPDDKTQFVIPHLGDLHQIHSQNLTKPTTLKNIDTSKLRRVNNDDIYTKVIELNTFKQQIKNVINEQTP